MRVDHRIFEEVTVSKTGKYKVKIDNDNKGQEKCPHLHLERKGDRLASIAIVDGVKLAGRIPADIRRPLATWLDRHRAALRDAWNQLQAGTAPDEIEWDV